jgi:hypothetical protein
MAVNVCLLASTVLLHFTLTYALLITSSQQFPYMQYISCCLFAEVAGLRRKLELYLSPESELLRSPWDIGECVGCWSRPNFDTVFYPYNPPHITRPKEVKKLFMVQLPENTYFGVSFRVNCACEVWR